MFFTCLPDIACMLGGWYCQQKSIALLTAISTGLALLVIENPKACDSLVDNQGMDFIIALLRSSVAEISLQARCTRLYSPMQ